MDVKSVGQNIKEIREKKKITQKRLAELSGRGESAISNYESGATDIPCSALLNIARALNCQPEEFFGVTHDGFNPIAELRIKASDIQTADYIKGHKGVDVYDIEDDACEVVFTNPPYNLMTKGNMLAEFQRIATNKVILLLNIFYLSSKERKQMLENSHLRHVYIHSDRVTMFPYGQEKPKNGGTKMYAWFVWDKDYRGKPTISWI